jgi:site-specific recombinase XerD
MSPTPVPAPATGPHLLDPVRAALRVRHHSLRTEEACVSPDLHRRELAAGRAITDAAPAAGLSERATSHSFRHSLATHLLQDDHDIRTVQELFGPENVETTLVYTHLLNRGGRSVASPLDGLG